MRKREISKFVRNINGIPLMSRMLLVDRTIPDINIRDITFHDGTALQYQAAHGTVEAMEWLLQQDPPAEPNLQDSNGLTALHWAVQCDSASSAEKFRLLLKYGADPTIKDKDGRGSPLDLAKKWENEAAISVLSSFSTGMPAPAQHLKSLFENPHQTYSEAFQILEKTGSALKGKESELAELLDGLGIYSAQDLTVATADMIRQLASLLKPIKKIQFLSAVNNKL